MSSMASPPYTTYSTNNTTYKDQKMQKQILLTSALFLFLSSCSTWRKFNDTERGAVIGGGTGALIGNTVSPGIGGTVVGGAAGAAGGALIGNEIQKNKKRH